MPSVTDRLFFNPAVMRFISAAFVVADADKKNLTALSFKRLGAFCFFVYLPEGNRAISINW